MIAPARKSSAQRLFPTWKLRKGWTGLDVAMLLLSVLALMAFVKYFASL